MSLTLNLTPTKSGNTRNAVLRQLIAYCIPVTAYQVSKDMDKPLNVVSPALKRLAIEGAIIYENKKYRVIPCLEHWQDHLPHFLPVALSIYEHNPHCTPEQISAIIGYFLSLIEIEIDESENSTSLNHDEAPVTTSPKSD